MKGLAEYYDELFVSAYAHEIDESWMYNYEEIWKTRSKLKKQQDMLTEKVRKIKTVQSMDQAGYEAIRSLLPAEFSGFQGGNSISSLRIAVGILPHEQSVFTGPTVWFMADCWET